MRGSLTVKKMQSEMQSAVKDTDSPEPYLIDHVIVLLRRKKIVAVFVLAGVLFSVAYALTTPNSYTATARLLIPQKPSQGLSGMLTKMQGNPVESLFGTASASDVYVGLLESRTVADRIIERFNLNDGYETPSADKAREMLKKHTNIVNGEEQILQIAVQDGDAERAAEMANAYAEELERINRRVNITESHLKRVFLEKRLEKVKEELLQAENRLRMFQERHGLVALDDQAKVTIEGAARIKGDIIAAQTELEVFKQFGSERNTEAVELKTRIEELSHQLSKIETGNDPDKTRVNASGRGNSNFYIPFNELPALGMELVRLTREAKIQEEVFQLVTSQYELAKIEEARDINTLQVLDRAVAPDRKSGPPRFLIVALSAVAGLFVGAIAAFFIEFLYQLKHREQERYRRLLLSLGIDGSGK